MFVSIDSTDSYEATIITNPDALIDRLEILAGYPQGKGTRDERFAAVEQVLLDHFEVAFDGVRSRPSVSRGLDGRVTAAISPAGSVDTLATIVLKGSVPRHATTLTMRSTFLFGPYPVTFLSGADGGRSTQWLQGDSRSAPVALTALSHPPSSFASLMAFVKLKPLVPNLVNMMFLISLCETRRLFASRRPLFEAELHNR